MSRIQDSGEPRDSFRRDPGETSERGAKRPRLPAVFEAVKAGRFDELDDDHDEGDRGDARGGVAAPEAERVLGEGVGEPGRTSTRGVSMCA